MSEATITRRYGPYGEGARISDRPGVEGCTFVDPQRFARLLRDGYASQDGASEPPAAPPEPATPALVHVATKPPRRRRGADAAEGEG